ncbi:MAG: Holliday junction branch migration protein RuvA [Deltaproteobacteria bacterium]|nr:MAG: Holliday junction branch migration protein RuvA [Deltaproteobacteria bacterium]
MIARLHGTFVEHRVDPRGVEYVVVDCGGVGYEAAVSAATRAALPAVGSRVTLHVHTHFAQDRFALYGFATLEERELFCALTDVDKMGPAGALKVLSAAGHVTAAQMIAAGDEAGLASLKGIGKATAKKIVFTLRERCELLLASWGAAGAGPGPTGARDPLLDEVAAALVSLGYRPAAADKAVAALDVPGDGTTLEMLLRAALQKMPR